MWGLTRLGRVAHAIWQSLLSRDDGGVPLCEDRGRCPAVDHGGGAVREA